MKILQVFRKEGRKLRVVFLTLQCSLSFCFCVMHKNGVSCLPRFSVFFHHCYLGLLFCKASLRLPYLLSCDSSPASFLSAALSWAEAHRVRVEAGGLALLAPQASSPLSLLLTKEVRSSQASARLLSLACQAFREYLLASCGSPLPGQSANRFSPSAPAQWVILGFYGSW